MSARTSGGLYALEPLTSVGGRLIGSPTAHCLSCASSLQPRGDYWVLRWPLRIMGWN